MDMPARHPLDGDLATSVPPRLLAELKSRAAVARLDAGAFFLRQGAPVESFALVLSGRVRVFRSDDGGREITLYNVRPGQCCIVNVLCMLSDSPSPAHAVCEEPVTACAVGAEAFRSWMRESDAMASFVFGLLATRVTGMMELISEVAFERLDRRLAALLAKKTGEMEIPVLMMTHEAIAGELGTAREVVSRLLKDLEHRGALELSRGRIEIRDRKILDDLSL